MSMAFAMLCILATHALVYVNGHARLWDPPARSTMWRMGFNTLVNTNDNELNCGGYENQWINLRGRCGVCGDPYQQRPRQNEAGGKYATGIISRHYSKGDAVTFVVDITANHVGYFEFRLCPASDDVSIPVTQSCLDKHPVLVIGSHDGRYHVKPHENGLINVKAKLPESVACNRCVLQWRYRTGNRWNCDRVTSKCGKGLGSQEEFYGCADISILDIRFAMMSDLRTEPSKGKGQPKGKGTSQLAALPMNAVTRTKITKNKKSELTQSPIKQTRVLSDMKKTTWRDKANRAKQAMPAISKPNKTVMFKPKTTKLWEQNKDHRVPRQRQGMASVLKHLGKPQPQYQKKQLMRKLSKLLWTLLKSLTSSNQGTVNNERIGLVNWDPVAEKFGSDIVYLSALANKTRNRGPSKGQSRAKQRVNWPITKPTFVELQHDGEIKPMILSELSFLDKLPSEKSKAVVRKPPPKVIDIPTHTCVGRTKFRVISGINEWCTVNCKAGNCPSVMCDCTQARARAFKRTPSTKNAILAKNIRQNKLKSTRHRPPVPKKKNNALNCRGTGLYVRDKTMVIWCTNNCNKGFCPKTMCYCTT